MSTPISQEESAIQYAAWLRNGGEQELKEALARAKATSEQFARSTRVRYETLLEPMDF